MGLGVTVDFRIELDDAGRHRRGRETACSPGNLTAIGLAAGQVTAEERRQDEAARILARLAFHYLDRWNRSDDELAALLRVVADPPVRLGLPRAVGRRGRVRGWRSLCIR